jgi:hypothetical protein
MPAYRAERTLAQTVADIPPGVADRLILVDDASPDNTAQLARELGIEVHVHRENLGYGGNQKTCYTEALRSGADIVVLLHPDYQYEPKAVPLLIAPILAGDADMTFGSRFAGLGDPIAGGMPVYRYIGNRVTTILENLMLGSRFTELHSGLRAYNRSCLLSLPFLRYSDNFIFDSQLLLDAVTMTQRVVEVPIPTRYTKESSSIAIDSSLAYIAGTLGYCARQVVLRGRRGRRSNLSRAASSELPDHVPTSATPSHRTANAIRRDLRADIVVLLDAAGDYFVPGDRLLAAGAERELVVELAGERGWQPVPIEGGSKGVDQNPAHTRGREWQSVVDAIAFVDPIGELSDAIEELRRLRTLLRAEGLLVVATPTTPRGVSLRRSVSVGAKCTLTLESVRAVLTTAGFEMVEWIPPSHLGVDAHSRIRRWGISPGAPTLGVAVARPSEPAAVRSRRSPGG